MYHGRRKTQRDERGIITIIRVWTEEIVFKMKYFSRSILSLQEDRKETTSACQDKPKPSVTHCPSKSRWTFALFLYHSDRAEQPTVLSVLRQTPTPPCPSKSAARTSPASRRSSKSPDESLRSDQLL